MEILQGILGRINSKMKILIITNDSGGLYQFRYELLEHLVKKNQVYIMLPNGKYIDNMVDLGCKYISCDFDRRGTNPIEDLKQYNFYLKKLKEIKPDVVLTYTIKPNVYGGMACSKLKIPYIANITGLGTAVINTGIMQKITLRLYKYGLRKANTVFFQNAANLQFMKKHSAAKNNYALLPGSGVNLKNYNFEPYPDDDSIIKFVTIGRIMKDKGTDILLDAARIIKAKYSNVEFKLIGGFDEDYQSKVYSAHEEGIINYIGVQEKVHPYIKDSHAIIHPSFHEGLSNVLLEAASTGRPILATDVPGCIDTFTDGIGGIAFKSRSSEALVEAIEKFLALSNSEKSEMGKNARKKVEKEFSRDLVITAYDKAIAKALDKKRKEKQNVSL